MLLIPYNFDPEYSVEEINSCQHLIAEITTQPSTFSIPLKNFAIFCYFKICVVSKCYLV